MSGLLNVQSGLNGSTSSLQETIGRAYTTSFPLQSGSNTSVLNHSGGTVQGPHSIHGNFSISNIPGAFQSRISGAISTPTGLQQATGNISNSRYSINDLPNSLSQLSLASSHGYSAVINNNGNAGRASNPMANLNGGTFAWGLNSAGGSNMPNISSRLNLTGPQMVSMLSSSYSGSGMPYSQNQIQGGNSHLTAAALLNELDAHENAAYNVNNFPLLSGHPASAGGSPGPLSFMRKQKFGFTQQNQEFSFLNEDFPALPGYKGGDDEFLANAPQKGQLLDNRASVMQSHHQSGERFKGFGFGVTYAAHHQEQKQHASGTGAALPYLPTNYQDIRLGGLEARNVELRTIGLGPVNLSNPISGMGLYDQHAEQYEQFQKQSLHRVISPFGNEDLKSVHTSKATADRFGMLGLLSVIRMINPTLTSLALGDDLTTLGLNLNSPENLHKRFASPWSEGPIKGEPSNNIPDCYYSKQPPALNQSLFARFRTETLFYIFYSMPKEEAQVYAANELSARADIFTCPDY